MEAFTNGVVVSTSLLEFHINRGLQLTLSTELRREMQMDVPKIVMALVTERTILNLR